MEVQVQRSVLPQLNLTVDYVTSGSALSGAQPSAPRPLKKKNLLKPLLSSLPASANFFLRIQWPPKSLWVSLGRDRHIESSLKANSAICSEFLADAVVSQISKKMNAWVKLD